MPQKIILTGAPGTGKTTVLNLLSAKGHYCMEEVSREIIQEAERMGSKKLFLSQPILFSKIILGKRIIQYQQAKNSSNTHCFFDRGMPDITAYLNSIRTPVEETFKQSNNKYIYDTVFIFPPWEQIYTNDSERFETYGESLNIHQEIVKEYKKSHHNIIIVPKGTPKERLKFILKKSHA